MLKKDFDSDLCFCLSVICCIFQNQLFGVKKYQNVIIHKSSGRASTREDDRSKTFQGEIEQHTL